MAENHENLIIKVIQKYFGVIPTKIFRMTTGICNEVYTAVMPDREVIVRMSPYEKFLLGSHNNIPIFKSLGIKVPEILGEDYGKTIIPYNYQIQSKIEGRDIDQVISTLNDIELKNIAKEISNILNKVKTIPTTDKFGVVWGGEGEFSDTWTKRMRIWVEESKERGKKTGVMDEKTSTLLKKLYDNNKAYFDTVKPVSYFGDMSSKNVMILDGKFNGLVDLDGYTQGDYLEGISRIKASWYGTSYGKIYTDALMDAQNLTPAQRKMVAVYALMNRISWACENGIQFNQNTKPVVNWKADKKNKRIIKILASEK